MLRALLIVLVFLILLNSFTFSTSVHSSASLRRITATAEHALNLNPSLSGDGKHIAFESSANLLTTAGNVFKAFHANLSTDPTSLTQLIQSRAVAPSLSKDGTLIVFASTEDPLGTNPDRNSELFLSVAASGRRELRQVTDTRPRDMTTRLTDGNFQPSISDDGRLVSFSSNRDLAGANSNNENAIFLVDTDTHEFTQLTSAENLEFVRAKIAGDRSVVVYIQVDPMNKLRSLVIHDVQTHASKVVATNEGLDLTLASAVSDNGSRVVYSAQQAEDQTQVFLWDARDGISRQITSLPARADDVPLNPNISGDGKRLTFSTRRNVIGGNSDHSVELYLFDIPTATLTKLTDAPGTAIAEVLSSLNDDGSTVAFNFPRVLSGPVSDAEFANNSEIYTLALENRPSFGALEVFNAASMGREPETQLALARGSITVARGEALSFNTATAQRLENGLFAQALSGTSVSVQGVKAELLFVSPTQVNFVMPPQTPNGPAEVSVTNRDGFVSRKTVMIVDAAPGIFTTNGAGTGEGCLLDAVKLTSGPFDPTGGSLRLTLFGTGLRNAVDVRVTIDGTPVEVEAIHFQKDLPGLDEVHLRVPAELRGAGLVDLNLSAGNRVSNPVTISLSGSSLRDIMINEFLADPPDGIAGDANYDGTRSASDDEFVELVNSTERDFDIGGFVLLARNASGDNVVRHRFAEGTILAAGSAVVIFGGGNPIVESSVFKGALVLEASTRSLSLPNSGGRISLVNENGTTISSQAYGGTTGLRGDNNQSLTRAPDVTGNFALHSSLNPLFFSPGTRIDQSAFLSSPAISEIRISPAAVTATVGDQISFSAQALDSNGLMLSDIIFSWRSGNQDVATIDRNGLAKTVRAGSTSIAASARGKTSSVSLVATVPSPSPTPTPVPSPAISPSPSPSPSPSVSASPSPNPSATPTPLPTPSPSASVLPKVVISQIYGGGGNAGAPFRNDFIEIFNAGTVAASLNGWSVQYGTATGSTWSVTSLPTMVLAPGQYYLVQQASGGANGGPLPAPDTGGNTAMAATAGKVALVSSTSALSGSCPTATTIIDFVGYGITANCFRGAAASPAPSNATAVLRINSGCTDTQNNTTDFSVFSPSPRNTSSTLTTCPPTLASLFTRMLARDHSWTYW